MNVEYCTFLGVAGGDGTIRLKPLGKARNKVKKPMLARWENVTTELVINKRYVKGLDGIEEYSHIIVVYWMDKEERCHLRHHPQGRADVPFVGIFACRCPQRPNRIAMSTVKLLARKGNVLKVKGLDSLNGTPILDIKPHWPVYDVVKEAKVPSWVNKLVF